MKTIAIGDIHGDLYALETLLRRLPRLEPHDSLVFLGDYCDRGPNSREVLQIIRELQQTAPFRVVALRGNHEDQWVRNYHQSHMGFLTHPSNGCEATWRSFRIDAQDAHGIVDEENTFEHLSRVREWLPRDVCEWMRELPCWYEDRHAIYVHAGLDLRGGDFVHPTESRERSLLWTRERDFFLRYRGKRVVFGHTRTTELPREVLHPAEDPRDVWCMGDLVGLDTGAGAGGWLSAISLPDMTIYRSR